MKNKKWFIILLFGLFLFLPKDVFAKSIYAYTNHYEELAKCENCDSLYVQKYGLNRVRFMLDTTNFILNSSYNVDLDFSVVSSSPYFQIGTCGFFVNGKDISAEVEFQKMSQWGKNGQYKFDFKMNKNYTFIKDNRGVIPFLECETKTPGDDANNYTEFLNFKYSIFTLNQDSSTAIENAKQDIITNDNKNTDRLIEEEKKTQETNKNILEKIIDLPSVIIEKLLDLLKSLFIPKDDYFSNKFDELNNTITKKLGVLGYPVVLVVDTLEFFLTLEDTGSYVISWDAISVPNFESHTIISAGSFDFATLLESKPINYLHNLYFIFINALLILSFMKLCNNTYARIFGGDVDEVEYISVAEENYFDEDGVLTGSKTIKKNTIRRSS